VERSGTILANIGNTPLVRLQRVAETPGVEIYLKCEFMNPGGSIKDRMALCMIEEAERRGDLKAGGTIVDQSTGNTGPALAFVGGVLGYNVQIFLPADLGSPYNSSDRSRIAALYGATVTRVNALPTAEARSEIATHVAEGGSAVADPNVIERAAAFVAIRMQHAHEQAERNQTFWWANQLCNTDNTKAHREHTGPEILEQMDGRIDAWVASVGTGGTLLGVGQALQERHPDLEVVGVLPTDDQRLEWVRSRTVHRVLEELGLPGMRFVIEDLVDSGLMTDEVTVKNADARAMANRLCAEEGIYCGMSSGANVHAAIELATTMKRGSRIVTVAVDRRDRYFAESPDEHYVV